MKYMQFTVFLMESSKMEADSVTSTPKARAASMAKGATYITAAISVADSAATAPALSTFSLQIRDGPRRPAFMAAATKHASSSVLCPGPGGVAKVKLRACFKSPKEMI